MLQRPVDKCRQIWSFPRHWWHGYEWNKFRVRMSRFVHLIWQMKNDCIYRRMFATCITNSPAHNRRVWVHYSIFYRLHRMPWTWTSRRERWNSPAVPGRQTTAALVCLRKSAEFPQYSGKVCDDQRLISSHVVPVAQWQTVVCHILTQWQNAALDWLIDRDIFGLPRRQTLPQLTVCENKTRN